ncbi:glycosyltransferase [Mariniphaga sp.]|uniref:glycosyltransferase n=1 Tax=Mariniphaga sp. TaxID=1954475 RepID=UPI0035654F88
MIAIIQPFIPHYRDEFFKGLVSELPVEIFTLVNNTKVESRGYKKSRLNTKHLKNFSIGPIHIYNFFPLLSKKINTIVLMGSVKHLSTWIILILNFAFKKKIILWGHGISNEKYSKESLKQPWLRKLMYKMANYSWFYTENELKIWQNQIPNLRGTALNNTISDIDKIISKPFPDSTVKKSFKEKYKIKTGINLIICVRFSNPNRKAELLVELMQILDTNIYGLIVIGDGPLKPDFNGIKNIYDFGAIYDFSVKSELFSIADLYLQPAWNGLSIVEALAHGLPVCTLKRSDHTHQGVEYNYLTEGLNAILGKNIKELAQKISEIDIKEYEKMRKSTKNFAKNNLSMKNMIEKAILTLKE